MEVRVMMTFSRDEIQKSIPYALVAETSSRAVWDTGKRKRLWKETFTEYEREKASRLCEQAKRWCFKKGTPDKVKMSARTFHLWTRLGEFCCKL